MLANYYSSVENGKVTLRSKLINEDLAVGTFIFTAALSFVTAVASVVLTSNSSINFFHGFLICVLLTPVPLILGALFLLPFFIFSNYYVESPFIDSTSESEKDTIYSLMARDVMGKSGEHRKISRNTSKEIRNILKSSSKKIKTEKARVEDNSRDAEYKKHLTVSEKS